jgi:prepilin peptidase CpaA
LFLDPLASHYAMSLESFIPSVPLALPVSSYALLVTLACLAAIIDLLTRRIPNLLVLSGAILGLALATWQGGISAIALSLGGLLLGFLLLLPGYLLRMTGGGDVKLMASLGCLLGPRLVMYAFVLYILAGLGWALIYALYAWAFQGAELPFARYWAMLRTFLRIGRAAYVRPRPTEAMGRRLPMAPAIAFGAIAAPLLLAP